jgi:hypothetical protein
MKEFNDICPRCGKHSLHIFWDREPLAVPGMPLKMRGHCALTCVACSWAKDVSWRWLLIRRYRKWKDEQRRKDAPNPSDSRKS